jgi:PAS domain S-box-containing protein
MSTVIAHILHLEDSDLDAEFVSARLRASELGCELERATDRKSFESALAGRKFDVILSDYQVPGFEGLDALMIAQAAAPDTPFIFVSGAMGEEAAVETLQRGATDYVLKERLGRLVPSIRRALAMAQDRRDKRAAEAALSDQQKLFRTTLASIGDGVICTDTSRRVTFLNAEAERLTGWTAAEAEGRSIDEVFRIVNEETRQTVPCPISKVLETGRVVGLANHTILISRNGEERPIDDSAAPIRDHTGATIGTVLVFRDVTERKRSEHSLRKSEARYRFLAESTAAAQSRIDTDDIMRVIAQMLVEHLDLSRCAYAVIEDESVFVITGDYSRGVPSIVGRWDVAAFGAACVEAMRTGVPFVVHDSHDDPRIAPSDLQAYDATNVRSVICVPLHKEGRFTAAMAVHQNKPRRWQSHEIELVQIVVDRCWEALERARVARDLRASEARYRAIVEATPECVQLIAPDGTLLQMNHAGFGMIEADESAIGQCVYDVIAPEFRDAFRSFNQRVCAGQRGVFEFDIIGLKGTRRHMETSAVPLPSADGAFTQLAVTRDITARVAAERTLADQRARLDYAARASGIGFWYCDLPFEELIWDERVKEHFFLPKDARVTIDVFYGRIHPEDRDPTRLAIEKSIATRLPYAVDYRTVDETTGAVKWIRALGGTGYGDDGRPLRFDGVTVDITTRKHDEERLAQLLENEREQGRMLAAMSGAALTIHAAGSLDSVLRVAAEEARRIFSAGHAAALLSPTQDRESSLAAATACEDSQRAIGKFLTSENDSARDVCGGNRSRRLSRTELAQHAAWQNYSAANPENPVFAWMAAPFVSHSGKNLGLLQVVNKTEGDFSELDEAMLSQFAHLTSVALENARLYGELREEDRRKDEFLAILAHELRNPLAPISTGLDILKATERDLTSREIRDMMERQLRHLVHLVDDLLDVSRVSRGKVQLRREIIGVANIVELAVETSRPLVEAARHQLSLSVPNEPLYVDGDLTRLAQVVSNLLNNAAKYTVEGGRIELSAVGESSCVVIRVTDSGVGIPREMLPKVFNLFTQVDRAVDRSQGGLGIGLSLVKRLVEMHGGSVTVESDGAGAGSTFTIQLPRVPAPTTTSQLPSQLSRADDGGLSKHRVLVVDDNVDAAITLSMLLKHLGCETAVAHSGPDALAVAMSFQPQIAFIDIGLPGLNGYEVAARLRHTPMCAKAVLVALTGWGSREDRQHSLGAGFNFHLTKPTDAAAIRDVMAAAAKLGHS